MERIPDSAALRIWREHAAAQGKRVALVPTMGALHRGHLALVDAAAAQADSVVMSIFVNPLQFGPREDFDRYPRDIDRDAALAAEHPVDALFTPSVDAMYGQGKTIRIHPGEAGDRWEGAIRPHHFDGVLTVVAKLFHLVQPDVAVFGQKDIQQVTLIRQMVRQLDFPIDLVVVPTLREPDGLAMSSRNVYLTTEQRRQAVVLSQALGKARQLWQHGERNSAALTSVLRSELDAVPGVVTDYIAVADPADLAPVAEAPKGTVVAVAARFGATRLIDNTILGMGDA